MRRLGFEDATIASVIGYLPDLTIKPAEIERHGQELHAQVRQSARNETTSSP